MKYGKGTIVFIRGTIFADDGTYDKIGHPGMIPIAVDYYTGDVYYLLLTSNISKLLFYPDEYYDLTDYWEDANLPKPSLVKLDYIYKGPVDGNIMGGLHPILYKDIIKELKRYQTKHPCPNYKEVESLL